MTSHLAGIERVAWPAARLGEAIEVLGRHAQLAVAAVAPAAPTAYDLATEADLSAWIEAAAAHLGLEACRVGAPYADVTTMLAESAPSIVTLPGGRSFVALVQAKRGDLRVLDPEHALRSVSREVLASALVGPLEATVANEVDATLEAASVPARRRPRARRALLAARLSGRRVAGVHVLSEAPGARLQRELHHTGAGLAFALQTGAHVAQLLLRLLALAVIGRAVLSDHVDRDLLAASMLLLVSAVPLQIVEQWYAGTSALEVGGVLKQRMLVGATRLSPEEVRADGSGSQLGRVLEADALQALAINGGAAAVMSLVEVVVALFVLARGAGGAVHALLLAGWCAAIAVLLGLYVRARRVWTLARLTMSTRMVERLVGYETRLAQERTDLWHAEEDRELESYQATSIPLDRALRRLVVLQTRGWLVVGLAALVPALANADASPGALAVGIGGVLLAHGALAQLARGLAGVADAAVGLGLVRPLVRAAARDDAHGSPDLVRRSVEPGGASLLEANGVSFRYRDSGDPVLLACSLTVRAGDRLLLGGDSGAGKSTLAAVLAGLRLPSSGSILSRGLDERTLGGEAFRRRIVVAPQFHENHIFGGTLAFNLLMGRRWPPSASDLALAEELCRDLDLGGLLDRMPGGLDTIVGDTGWRLSHGEKSRVYTARALLQDADVVIFDESFGALDPETLDRSIRCALDRATATVVIAHV